MKIALHSVYRERDPDAPSVAEGLRRCAANARRHMITDDWDAADAILITEVWRHLDKPFYRLVRHSPVVQKYAAKSFIYFDSDFPIYVLPGLYPSMSRQSAYASSQQSCVYLQPEVRRFESIEIPPIVPDLLFSFAGSAETHPVRRRVMQLRHPRAVIRHVKPDQRQATRAAMDLDYLHLMARSKFVLCPRGVGASSFRLFETMATGRVPVVISDDWLEPFGVDWAACSVRVAERDVTRIPQILEARESEFESLASMSHAAYRERFHTDAVFDFIGTLLERLMISGCRKRWSPYQPVLLYEEAKRILKRLIPVTARG